MVTTNRSRQTSTDLLEERERQYRDALSRDVTGARDVPGAREVTVSREVTTATERGEPQPPRGRKVRNIHFKGSNIVAART